MDAIINIATSSRTHAGKRSGVQKSSRWCFLFKLPSTIRRCQRGSHLIPVVIEGDTVSHVSSALEDDLFSRQGGNRAMLCVVLVLRLIWGNCIISGGLRISTTRSSAVCRLLAAAVRRIPEWCTSVRCGFVTPKRMG